MKCAECRKPRLKFAQKSLKENEKKSLKRALNGMEFICGTSFQEFVVDAKNEDINFLDKMFVRENLTVNIICPFWQLNSIWGEGGGKPTPSMISGTAGQMTMKFLPDVKYYREARNPKTFLQVSSGM